MWLRFIYDAVPEQYNPKFTCAQHILLMDSFLNLGEYNAGYIQILLTTVKSSTQVVLSKLGPINQLDHPHFRAQTDMVKHYLCLQLLKALGADSRDYGKGCYISDTLEVFGQSQHTESVDSLMNKSTSFTVI